MTVELEFSNPSAIAAGDWQVSMAKQIEANRGFPLESIERVVSGGTLIVRVETTLPDAAVDGIVSTDVPDHLPNSSHVETREV